jgi:mono/diheme cytochrome c family protein
MKASIVMTSLVLIYVIGIVCCTSRRSEPVKQKEFIANEDAVVNGEKVFMQYCQRCHPGGEGGLGPSINSNPAPQFIKRFQMRHGLGVMPSFKREEISKEDLRAISDYLNAWKEY